MERRPFHEVVVGVIQGASSAELEVLGTLLLKVVIPKNHREIAEAWVERCSELGMDPLGFQNVAESIICHKRSLEEEARRVDRETAAFISD